jgi:hypothetical protein
MIQPIGAAIRDGGGDEEEGDSAETPLAQLMGRGIVCSCCNRCEVQETPG